MFVELQFMDEANDDKIVTIKRTASYLKTKDISGDESAESTVNHKEIELKYFTPSKGQEIINNEGEVKIYVDAFILNDNLKEFFFFDGEDLSEFIKDNKAKSIETDIDILTGISDIDKTKKNLEALKRKVKESIPKIIKKGDALRKAEKNVITCMMILNHMRKLSKSTKKD